jgi:hypothetical protein
MTTVEECISCITRWLSLPHLEEYGHLALDQFKMVLEGRKSTRMTKEEVQAVLDHFSETKKKSDT